MKHLFLLLILLFLSSLGFAGSGNWEKRIQLGDLTASSYKIQEPGTFTGQDVRDYRSWKGYVHFDYTRNGLSDLLEQHAAKQWRIQVSFTVNNETAVQTLEIIYQPTLTNPKYVYSDFMEVAVDALEEGFTIKNVKTRAWYCTNTTNNLYTQGIPLSNASNAVGVNILPADVDLRLELRCEQVYKLEQASVTPDMAVIQFNPANFRVNWQFLQGAEAYDLEWVFIDALSDEKTTLNTIFGDATQLATGYARAFELEEPTRMRLWGTNFTLDRAYPDGQLYFRVRGIGQFVTNGVVSEQLKEGEWSYFQSFSQPSNAPVINATSVLHYAIAAGFETDKNWLYGVSFAENGKNVSTVSYYDGSNRGRQNIAYNTSDQISLVGESKFDYEGRPTVSVVPAPVAGRQLGYRNNFNLVAANDPFDENDIDRENYLTNPSPALSTLSGAARYFSPANDFTNDPFRAAIPNANGYVYSQTIYRNDGSGRVERVGGVGADFRANTDHAIRTYYGSPTEVELKRLFGTNVADDPKGYRKELVRDANGQYSVAYYDKRGNTIATALAGNAPANLLPLDGIAAETLTADLTDNNILVDGHSFISEHTFLNTVENQTVTFNYGLTGLVNLIQGQTVTVGGQEVTLGDLCSTCGYHLEILVQNSDGQALPNFPYQMDITPSGTCDPANPISWTMPPLTAFLAQPGEYRIIKTLTIDETAMAEALGSLEDLADYPAFLAGYLDNVDVTGCFNNCNDYCIAAIQLGYAQTNGVSAAAALAYWNGLSQQQRTDQIAACTAKECDPNDSDFGPSNPQDETPSLCDALRMSMLRQISPGGVFYDNPNSAFWNAVPASLVVNGLAKTHAQLQDPAQFVPAMAEAMLPYHRESRHLLTCDEWSKSVAFGQALASLVNNTPWNANAALYAHPYEADAAGYTQDPFRTSANFDVGLIDNVISYDILAVHIDRFLTEHTSSLCAGSTTGNLAAYAERFVACLPGYSSMTAAQIEAMRKNIFLGSYNQLKEELVRIYKTTAGCVYPTDDNAIFPGPKTQAELSQLASEALAGILAVPDCRALALARTRSWIDQMPTGCLLAEGYLQENSAGEMIFTYDPEESITSAYPYPQLAYTMTQCFYGYAMSTCATNPLGLFYNPGAGNPGYADYQATKQHLEMTCGTYAQPPFEVSAPAPLPTGLMDQQFPACFQAFLRLMNQGMDAYNASHVPCEDFTQNCTQSVLLAATLITNPALAGCTAILPATIQVKINQNGIMFHFVSDNESTTDKCNIAFYVKDYLHPDVVWIPGLPIDTILHPSKDTLTVDGVLQNVVRVDVVLSDGTVQQGYFIYNFENCIPAGSFDPGKMPDLSEFVVPYADPTVDCIQSEVAQATIDAEQLFDDLLEDVYSQYLNNLSNCLDVTETFSMNYALKEYQYTLYYHDLAGNLVQTVPPQGVDILTMAEVAANANPDHHMETRYRYNGMNTLISQGTPDGGISQFYVDKLYRVCYSQSAQQANPVVAGDYRASYMNYDALGRITEAGELKMPAGYIATPAVQATYLQSRAYGLAGFPGAVILDYTHTYYDEGYAGDASIAAQFANGQENLRNTIGSIVHRQADYDAAGAVLTGTQVLTTLSYSYDPHKNVKQVVSTNSQLKLLGQEHKTTRYSYDLLSGNVNEVIYQPGKADEYHYGYDYDANNRLVRAFSSTQGIQWELDAKYFYYLHGPLARTELGHDQVQGTDYAYNLQGWLKGVNSAMLDATRDLGKDAGKSGLHKNFGADAMGFQLGYFTNDYASIATTTAFANTSALITANGTQGNLYNGNITHMVAAMRKTNEALMDVLGNNYKYDQLQRIREANPNYASGLLISNNFTGAALYRQGAYQESYTYDKNGNIKTLTRNGSGLNSSGTFSAALLPMDNFTYSYDGVADGAEPLANNKLRKVSDAVTSTYATDIKPGQVNANYVYNASGQLITDVQEGIANIVWTVTGKVKQIIFSTAGQTAGKRDLKFIYDPMDRRIAKVEYVNATDTKVKYTYYSYDASGNVLATYDRVIASAGTTNNYTDQLTLNEHHLYGSQRLGVENSGLLVAKRTFTTTGNVEIGTITNNVLVPLPAADHTFRLVNDRRYELSNHLGNVLEVITDRKLPNPAVVTYQNDFSANYAPFYVGGQGVLSLTGGRLKVDNLSTYNVTGAYGTTIPGRQYEISFKIELAGQISLLLGGSNTAVLVCNSSGSYTYSFVAGTSTSTGFMFQNTGTVTQPFYLDDVVIREVSCYLPEVVSYADYSPFGTVLDSRHGEDQNYRYGFNGQEKDDEVKGEGNSYDFGARFYDNRISRFLSLDPQAGVYPFMSPYCYASNNPIRLVDINGEGPGDPPYIQAASMLAVFLGSEHFYSDRDNGKAWVKHVVKVGDIEMELRIEFNDQMNRTQKADIMRTWGITNDYSYEAYLFMVDAEDTWARYGNWLEYDYYKEPPLPVEVLARFLMAVPGTIYGWSTGNDWMTGEKLSGLEQALGILDVIPGEALAKAGIVGLMIKYGDELIDATKLTKSLKFADEYGKCREYASVFMKTMKGVFESGGAIVKKYEINIGAGGFLGTTKKGLSNNGMHQFIEVVKDGTAYIYDNMHSEGMLKTEYMEEIAGDIGGFFISGQELLKEGGKYLKEVQ